MTKCLFIPLILLNFISCSSVNESSSNDKDDSDGDDSGTTDFIVSGQLDSLTVSSLTRFATDGTVTDVIAINPTTGDTECKTEPVNEDGTFEIELGGGKPWFFYFIDQTTQDFLGRFKSGDSDLDTLIPTSDAEAMDLGTLTINADTEIATPSIPFDDLLSGLGITDIFADFFGQIDDIATRYQNPDVDGDGELDCQNEEQNFILDFHVRYNMTLNSSHVTVDDMIGDFLDVEKADLDYQSTGVYVAYPTSYSSEDTGSVTFVDVAVTTEEGGLIPANTATSDVTTNNFNSYNGFGPNMISSSELPSGTIIFSFGDKTLNFSNVQTPSLEEIATPEGRIFLFIKFVQTDSTCTSSCALSSLGYQWLKKTAESWEAASLEELELLVASETGNLSFRMDDDESKTVGFPIPSTSTGGDIEWSSSNANLEGVSSEELTSMTTTQICHMGLSYDDQLGTRYFHNINDASGTCNSSNH